MLKNVLKFICLCMVAMTIGCHAYVNVDKRPNIALPIYDNKTNLVDWVVVDQGYEVTYSKWGFNTQIEHMSAEISTNKTVTFNLGGLASIASTNTLHVKLEDVTKLLGLIRTIPENELKLEDSKQ